MSATCARQRHILEGILNVKVTDQLRNPPYGILGTATELVSDVPAYCLKEAMELERRRGAPCADPLHSLTANYWRRETGALKDLKVWLES
ncbi:hypothetical protein TNCV_3140411 [Trichonephila clavipes]|nr:hypothetical protein TNCV_3140411 [Trichonephila clavipes]